jgi:hypothetical protein
MAFDLALYPPTMRNRSGRLSLLQWGVAVSSNPRKTSSPRESSHYPEAVSFLCPCQDSRPAASAAHLLSERGLSSAGLRGTQTYRQPSAFSWQYDSMSRNYKRLSEGLQRSADVVRPRKQSELLWPLSPLQYPPTDREPRQEYHAAYSKDQIPGTYTVQVLALPTLVHDSRHQEDQTGDGP